MTRCWHAGDDETNRHSVRSYYLQTPAEKDRWQSFVQLQTSFINKKFCILSSLQDARVHACWRWLTCRCVQKSWFHVSSTTCIAGRRVKYERVRVFSSLCSFKSGRGYLVFNEGFKNHFNGSREWHVSHETYWTNLLTRGWIWNFASFL